MNGVVTKPSGMKPATVWTLPARAYTDPSLMKEEKERIFFRTWQYVGHECELARPGDYITARIVDEGIFVVRTQQGKLEGFYNVCKHRAHELLQGSGRLGPIITCPYHAWAYDLHGRLSAARGSENVLGFDKSEIQLSPVRVESLLGLVFVNLDPDALPLAESYKGLSEQLEAQVPGINQLTKSPAQADGGETWSYRGRPGELRTNWKVLLDNSLECYHCSPSHPAFSELADLATYRITEHGTFTTHVAHVRPQNSAYRFGSSDPVQRITFWHLWPNVILALMPGLPNLGAFKFTPTRHDLTAIHYDSFRLAGPLTESESARMRYGAEVLWPEDEGLCEAVWRGLHSRSYSEGRLMMNGRLDAMSEEPVRFFHRLWTESMDVSSGK